MRVLFISQWWDPEPFFKTMPFARELVRRGHEVDVLTGFPNYPGGKLYDGYQLRFVQRENMDGVSVIRVPLYPSHDKSALRRIANYASLALSMLCWGTLVIRRPDIIYVFALPTLTLPAVAVRARYRAPIVFDLEDLWPDAIAESGMLRAKALMRMVNWWCIRAYQSVDRIVTISPGFRAALLNRGIPDDKVEVIYNWCDESNIAAQPRAEGLGQRWGMTDHFSVVYAGNMGIAQQLDVVLDCAALLGESTPSIQFVMVGDGVDAERLRSRAVGMGLGNVRFIPRVPYRDVGGVLVNADALLVHLTDAPLFRLTIPSKTQAYLAAGKPILIGNLGDAADLVTRAGAGLPFIPGDPNSLADAVKTMCNMPIAQLREMGQRGRDFYVAELSLRAGVDRFEDLFHRVLDDR